jgi:DNA-binding beta-propeller fold protein YncE
MLLAPCFRLPFPAYRGAAAKRPGAPRRRECRLHLETLEGRLCPSGGYLLVTDYDTHTVMRYDETTGAFVDRFVPKHSGGLNQPNGLIFGPRDHNLYVVGGEVSPSDQHRGVLRYDGGTGEFLNEFADSAHLTGPHAVIFGPDGNLYVGDGLGSDGQVVRYNGTTGAFMDNFVPPNSGGLARPFGLVFGPDGKKDGQLDLYVLSRVTNSVKRYDGTTGAYLGDFVASGSGGLDHPTALTFGPDGNLYVAAGFGTGASAVFRFQGPSGRSPGSPLPAAGNSGADFVASGSGGLLTTFGLIFGPDGNGDGRQDLYLPSFQPTGGDKAKDKLATIKRYDGVTGAFIDTFVTANSGGLDQPSYLIFTETDSVTLAYTGGDRLAAVAAVPHAVTTAPEPQQAQPLLTEALARWRTAGMDARGVGNVPIQITNLGGTPLGMASGYTIRIDDNDTGCGWFVDTTLSGDSEFTTPGNQGEQNRIDLLSAPAHEASCLLRPGP